MPLPLRDIISSFSFLSARRNVNIIPRDFTSDTLPEENCFSSFSVIFIFTMMRRKVSWSFEILRALCSRFLRVSPIRVCHLHLFPLKKKKKKKKHSPISHRSTRSRIKGHPMYDRAGTEWRRDSRVHRVHPSLAATPLTGTSAANNSEAISASNCIKQIPICGLLMRRRESGGA